MKLLRVFDFMGYFVFAVCEAETRDTDNDYLLCFNDSPSKKEVYDICVKIGESFCRDPEFGQRFCDSACKKFPDFVWESLFKYGKLIMSGDSDRGFDWVGF